MPSMTALRAPRTCASSSCAAGMGISGVNMAVAEIGQPLPGHQRGQRAPHDGTRRAYTSPDGAGAGRAHRRGSGRRAPTPRAQRNGPGALGPTRASSGPRPARLAPAFPAAGSRSRTARIRCTSSSSTTDAAGCSGTSLAEILTCIRCGACLNICPVYRHIGGHAYDSVYPGPIGAVVTPDCLALDGAVELPHASSLCGACRDVCPVRIDLPHSAAGAAGACGEPPGRARAGCAPASPPSAPPRRGHSCTGSPAAPCGGGAGWSRATAGLDGCRVRWGLDGNA